MKKERLPPERSFFASVDAAPDGDEGLRAGELPLLHAGDPRALLT